MNDKYTKNTQGFTLVELSIVIIIGFLIAGIAAGQSLIKQAKLNSLIDSITEINTAIVTFKLTYGYLPGDFPNATAYWPSEVCLGLFGSGAISCDGDGNGLIDGNEAALAWDHFNQSKIMLASNFVNTSLFSNELLNLRYSQTSAAILYAFGAPLYATDLTNVNVIGVFDSFNSVDVYSIDNKMDDGNPSSGKLMAYGPASPGCTVEPGGTSIDLGNYSGSDAMYALSNNNTLCNAITYIFE